MANYNDDYNYIDIDLPTEREKAKNGRKTHSQPTKKQTGQQNSKRNNATRHPAQRRTSVSRQSRKHRKKQGFFAKYSLYFALIAIIVLIIAAVAVFSNCSGDKNAVPATMDEASGLEIITISIQGERVFYNGTEINGLEEFKNQLEKDFNHNKTINLVHDEADRKTYENVKTIIDKVEADEIKEKESIAKANETTVPTTAPVTSDTASDNAFPSTYPREDYESDGEGDSDNMTEGDYYDDYYNE